MTWTHYVVRKSRLNKEKPEIRYESKFGGCKAMFRLRYAVNRFVISSSRMIHNHSCDQKCLKNDTRFRRLSEDQLKVVLPMVKTGSSAESIVKYAEENFENTITVHYVNNLKYKFVGRCGSLNDVIATLRNNGKLFVSYGGVANQVTRIAFSKHEQIVTYKRLPEVVCLHSTHNTNRGKRPSMSGSGWTWQAVQDVDGNIPAIPSLGYNETNKLYRTLRIKIHTLSTLFGQTTVQDTQRQLTDHVNELIRMRRLATVSEHGKSTGSLEIKI
ncbi:unnamed protein product [Schistosoma curassoni]|uniref:Protein FAR1-RELATED SEQUENCE n=1 Tax=Schistosoma curassoni TaxID=6186 RepID=A0A183JPE1_9TREM|nr:unnamed protein product [Schistosoma curassoni]